MRDYSTLALIILALLLMPLFTFGCDCCGDDCDECKSCPADDDASPDDDTSPDDDASPDDDDDSGDDDNDDDSGDDDDDNDDDNDDNDDDLASSYDYLAGGTFSGAAVVMNNAGLASVISSKSRYLLAYRESATADYNTVIAAFGIYANPSAAVGPDGSLHLAFYDWYAQTLWYATNHGGSWHSAAVDEDGDVGHYSAIAVDGDGVVHIAYTEESSRTPIGLRYANNAARAWSTESVTTGNGIGAFPSLAVDGDGVPYITFNTGGAVRLAVRTAKGWSIDDLSDSVSIGRASGVAIDGSGVCHVIYHATDASSNLRHAYGEAKALTSELIPGATGVGDTLAMTVDDDDVVHFVYYNSSLGARYGNNAAKDWQIATIGSAYPVYIAARSVDNVAISIARLGVYRQTGGGWQQLYLDNGFVAQDTALDRDAAGHLQLAYIDDAQTIWHMTDAGGEWTRDQVTGVIGNTALNIDLKTDGNNHAHICYYNGVAFQLEYATNATGSWVSEVVDEGDLSGRHCAMFISNDNVVHLSYSDETNGTLMYANNAGGGWTSTSVDDEGYVGTWSDIVVKANGEIAIAYVDLTDNDINLARGDGTDWTIATVDPEGGDNVSLAVDDSGHYQLAYIGAGLRHAQQIDDQWVLSTIDAVAQDEETGIVAGDPDHVMIAYQSIGTDLSIAWRLATAWHLTVVDQLGSMGDHLSITAGGADQAYVSYLGQEAIWLATVGF